MIAKNGHFNFSSQLPYFSKHVVVSTYTSNKLRFITRFKSIFMHVASHNMALILHCDIILTSSCCPSRTVTLNKKSHLSFIKV